ncbi:MAG TPA: hypothetical protein VFV20_05410 [Candidatus Limnocylindria bacterium]|nr:hypothetical protein [Candidatus Limnocylindria bacterium]
MFIATLVVVLVALPAAPAHAWDPLGDEFDAGPGDPDPMPFVVPEGLYAVTDVYAGDVVTTSGGTTTYTTETIHDTPGTFARVVDVVDSGAGSRFDGASFNGRAALPDGRPVAGIYYEDFVLTASGFVSVNIVFFQDDSAFRAPAPTAQPPAATLPPSTTPSPVAPVAAVAVPRASATPAPTARPTPEPEPARPIVATAGVALGPDAPVLTSIEILRGRTVRLWPRAFVGGAPVATRSWRLVSGAADVMTRTAGGPGDACDATWLAPTLSAGAAVLRFEITTDAAPGRVLTATIAVAVRSPALMQ